jgi:zinc D-Ala-D-Ala carboxypeptidase
MVKKLLLIWVLSIAVFAAAAPAEAATADDSCRLMLVNNQHMFTPEYVPTTLTSLDAYLPAGEKVQMTKEAAEAAGRMFTAMTAAGLTDLFSQSGYRDYDTQQLLNSRKYSYFLSKGYSAAAARKQANSVVAIAGASEHQSGLAIDFTTTANGHALSYSFGSTPVGRWLAANSWRYGFILRYPSGKEEITGYIYEPWHFRYVGEPHAEYMYQNDLCLEEYYQLLQRQQLITYLGEDGATYAIYFSAEDDADIPGDTVLTTSRAYADSMSALVFTARVPEIDYLSIVSEWAVQDYRTVQTLTELAGLPAATVQPEQSITPEKLLDLLARVYLRFEAAGEDSGNEQIIAYLEQVLASAESYCLDSGAGAVFFQPLLAARPAGLLTPQMLLSTPVGTFSALQRPETLPRPSELMPLYLARPELPFANQLINAEIADPELQAAVRVLAGAGVLPGGEAAETAIVPDFSWSEISAMLSRKLEAAQTGSDLRS